MGAAPGVAKKGEVGGEGGGLVSHPLARWGGDGLSTASDGDVAWSSDDDDVAPGVGTHEEQGDRGQDTVGDIDEDAAGRGDGGEPVGFSNHGNTTAAELTEEDDCAEVWLETEASSCLGEIWSSSGMARSCEEDSWRRGAVSSAEATPQSNPPHAPDHTSP